MRALTGLALALGLLMAEPAAATTIAPLSVEQITDASDLVVRGTVAELRVEMDEHGHVVTYADIEVAEGLKGLVAQGDFLTIEAPGGVLDGAATNVDGAPRFSEGEDVVLFLASKRFGTAWGCVGLFQGKYTVKQDPSTGRDMVVQFAVPYTRTYDARFVPNPPKGERVMLDDLEARVRARVELGWDGKAIPGVSAERLREINRLQPGVR